MSERSYSVVSSRVTQSHFRPTRTLNFYVPRIHEWGFDAAGHYVVQAKAFLDEGDYPCIWGFELEADAWKACDTHERARLERDEEAYDDHDNACGRGDREDFHADG
jgi:hypothetical protein